MLAQIRAALFCIFALFAFAVQAKAQQYLFFPQDAAINYSIPAPTRAITGWASIEDANLGRNPTSPTISVVSGANIDNSLEPYNGSTINMFDGYVGYLGHPFTDCRINIRGGTAFAVTIGNTSTLNISGGTVTYYVAAQTGQNPIVNITGGNIGRVLADGGIFNISGGHINEFINIDSSTVNFTSGTVAGDVTTWFYGILNYRGGNVNGVFRLNELINNQGEYIGGTLNIYGKGLTANYQFFDSTTASSVYAISGRLTDGTILTRKDLYVRLGTLNLINAPMRVTGSVNLQGTVNPAQSITLQFRPTVGTADPLTRTVTLGNDGTFALYDIPSGRYQVSVKAAKYLKKSVTIDNTNDPANIAVSLLAGDANDDNAVDIADLLLVISAYNKTAPNAGYLDAADFNGDGANDIADLLLLIGNYNQLGDS